MVLVCLLLLHGPPDHRRGGLSQLTCLLLLGWGREMLGLDCLSLLVEGHETPCLYAVPPVVGPQTRWLLSQPLSEFSSACLLCYFWIYSYTLPGAARRNGSMLWTDFKKVIFMLLTAWDSESGSNKAKTQRLSPNYLGSG